MYPSLDELDDPQPSTSSARPTRKSTRPTPLADPQPSTSSARPTRKSTRPTRLADPQPTDPQPSASIATNPTPSSRVSRRGRLPNPQTSDPIKASKTPLPPKRGATIVPSAPPQDPPPPYSVRSPASTGRPTSPVTPEARSPVRSPGSTGRPTSPVTPALSPASTGRPTSPVTPPQASRSPASTGRPTSPVTPPPGIDLNSLRDIPIIFGETGIDLQIKIESLEEEEEDYDDWNISEPWTVIQPDQIEAVYPEMQREEQQGDLGEVQQQGQAQEEEHNAEEQEHEIAQEEEPQLEPEEEDEDTEDEEITFREGEIEEEGEMEVPGQMEVPEARKRTAPLSPEKEKTAETKKSKVSIVDGRLGMAITLETLQAALAKVRSDQSSPAPPRPSTSADLSVEEAEEIARLPAQDSISPDGRICPFCFGGGIPKYKGKGRRPKVSLFPLTRGKVGRPFKDDPNSPRTARL